MELNSTSAPTGSLRAQQAATTRRRILLAARPLFAEYGFAETSVKGLAAGAGVAVQTIYSSFGSKAGVLAGLVDLLDEEANLKPVVSQLQREDDPREILALYARAQRQVRERGGDIIAMLRSGAALDTRVAEVWAEGLRRRHGAIAFVIARLDASGALKAELGSAAAEDIVAALATEDVCDVLVTQRGWRFADYERWLRESLETLLLSQSSHRSSGRGAL